MMANSPADILGELEAAVASCPLDRCARILSGIVQLLTGSRDRSQELLSGVVDGVLLQLTERVETSALIQLSTTLADLKVAPPETLRRLASHDNADVACPVLLNIAGTLHGRPRGDRGLVRRAAATRDRGARLHRA